MNKIALSYVVTTRNKLPYLKEVMKRLLVNAQEDEEIVVVDGASTDGTVEYLTDLYKQGKIHQFISEPDRGEAHGYNKGFLMARGELIKDITDDDAFYYPAIQECKKFMLEHEEVDVISGNSANVNLEDLKDISDPNLNYFTLLTDSEYNYRKWLENGGTAWFVGLPLIIRKKSLAMTGLYFTGAIQVDLEYSLRITQLDANIAWNTALMSVRIDNPQSGFRSIFNNQTRYLEERNRFLFCYDHIHRKNYYKEIIKSFLRPVKRVFYQTSSPITKKNVHTSYGKIDEATIAYSFNTCDKFMEEINSKNSHQIIRKH